MTRRSLQNRFPAHRDPMVEYAIQRIERDYGHICVANRKDLNKFGGNPSLGATEKSLNSWGEDEVFQSSNITLKMTSTSTSDAGKLVSIEYMYYDGADLIFGVMSDVALDGTNPTTNKVDLPSAGSRWLRMYSTQDMVGDVYVYRDGAITGGVPSDLTTVHCAIPAGENQSQKAGTSVSSTNYFILFNYWADMIGKASALGTIKLKIRSDGEGFRTSPRRGLSADHAVDHTYKSALIIKPNSDIIMTGISSTSNTDFTGGFSGIFADIVDTSDWGQ